MVIFVGSSKFMRSETRDFLHRLEVFTEPVPAPPAKLMGWAGQIYEVFPHPFISPWDWWTDAFLVYNEIQYPIQRGTAHAIFLPTSADLLQLYDPSPD